MIETVTAKNALAIYDGACNPRAIARELVKAIDEACQNGSDGAASQDAAPARVILCQLCFLMKASFDSLGGCTSMHGNEENDLSICRMIVKLD